MIKSYFTATRQRADACWTGAGAYGAAVCAAAYGSMKLAQALGFEGLAGKDPLPPGRWGSVSPRRVAVTEVRPPLAGNVALAGDLAYFDLLLWSPFFLVLGLCWTAVGRRLHRTGTGTAAVGVVAGPSAGPPKVHHRCIILVRCGP